MDIQFAAGVVTYAADHHRYAGTTMLSALPDAPVVPMRSRRAHAFAAWLTRFWRTRTLSVAHAHEDPPPGGWAPGTGRSVDYTPKVASQSATTGMSSRW